MFEIWFSDYSLARLLAVPGYSEDLYKVNRDRDIFFKMIILFYFERKANGDVWLLK